MSRLSVTTLTLDPSHMVHVLEDNHLYVDAQAKRSGAVPTRFTTATNAPLRAPNDQAQVLCPKDFWLTRTASKILQPAWMVGWLTISRGIPAVRFRDPNGFRKLPGLLISHPRHVYSTLTNHS
eukprot:COSAG04_NODE_2188_length_4587_cov_28.548128_3_plen_123_part_00